VKAKNCLSRTSGKVKATILLSKEGAESMSPLKPCAEVNCRALVPLGQTRCPACEQKHRKDYDRRRGTAAARGYGGEWRKIREHFLLVKPWCEVEGCREMATEVHHRKRLRDGGTHHPSNLVALCKSHHSQVTAQEDGGFGNVGKRKK
jgi:5-methylcytosine-specific restriction protein A